MTTARFISLLKRSIAVILPAILFSGCATVPPSIQILVNGFAAPEAQSRTRFVIIPGLQGIDSGDLEFREYSEEVSIILQRRGFKRVQNADNAEVAIFLAYSISGPQAHSYNYSLPVFGETGVASSITRGTITSTGNGFATYSGTTTNIPSFGVTGYTTQTRSFTTFTRTLDLDAADIVAGRQSGKMVELWKTRMVSTGLSGDLRHVVPYLLVAAEPYVASNTGQQISVILRQDDNRVAGLRNLQP